MKRLYWLILGLILALFAFFWMRGCDRRIDRNTASTVLSPNVVEKIIVNPTTHKLSIVTHEGQKDVFLPDRPSSIEIDKKGSVSVTSRQFGTEIKPFVGFQFSDTARIAFGADLLYYKKLDLGLGVTGRPGNYAPVGFVKLAYTVWSNTQVGVTFDTGSKIGGIICLRF